MFDIEASLDSRLLAVPRNRPTVVFPEALDPRTLEAACFLGRFIRPVFLAPEAEVRAVAAQRLAHLGADRVAYTLSESAFVDPASRPDLVESFAAACVEFGKAHQRPVSLDEARDLVREPGRFGIWAVKLGHADMVVGGAIHEPKAFFRPMVDILAQRSVTCEAGVFVLPESLAPALRRPHPLHLGDFNPFRLLKKALSTKPLRALFLGIFLTRFAHVGMQTNFAVYTLNRFKFTPAQNGVVLTVLGITSLYLIQEIVTRTFNSLIGWIFTVSVTILSSVGVYLGRFLSWNSWDLLQDPLPIAKDMYGIVRHPFTNLPTYGFTILFTLLILFIYVAIHLLGSVVRERPPR